MIFDDLKIRNFKKNDFQELKKYKKYEMII